MHARRVLVLLIGALALAAPAGAAPPPVGGLSPVPGGCVTAAAVAGCGTDTAIADVQEVAVSPTAHVVYLLTGSNAPSGSTALLAYALDPATGKLGAQVGKVDLGLPAVG